MAPIEDLPEGVHLIDESVDEVLRRVMKQGTLFDLTSPDQPVVAYQRHSETSIAAAAAIKPHISELEQIVLEQIRLCGGCTDDELLQALCAEHQIWPRPRRIRLVELGLVVDSGLVRKTRSGRNAVVWRCAGSSARKGSG